MQSTRSKRNEGISPQLRSLNFVNKKIAKLEDELSKVRQEHDRLETQIAHYYASKAPISRIPTEVLAMIFEEYAKQQHPHIRCIILVCRHWYQLVMETPRLWAHVQIYIDLKTPNQIDSALKYAEACLTRSKSSLLHIVMDFGHFPTKFEHVDSMVSDPFKALLNQKGFWFDVVEYHELEEHDLAYDRDIGKCTELVTLMASQSERWQSLDVSFRSNEAFWLFDEVWAKFPQNTPKLTELIMEGVETENLPGFSAGRNDIFNASPLKILQIADPRILANIATSQPSLEVLSCDLEVYPTNFLHIYSFGNLTQLTLVGGSDCELSGLAGANKLRLPSLWYLSLQLWIPEVIIALLDTPMLKTLHIIPSSVDPILPEVSPVEVICRSETRHFRYSHHSDMTEPLRAVLRKYPGMQTFETEKRYMDQVLLLVAEIREEGMGLRGLKSITFVEETVRKLWEGKLDSSYSRNSITIDTRLATPREELVSEVTAASS